MRNLLKLLPLAITAATACPFPGPVLPQPKALARSPVLSAVLKNFTEALDSAVAGDTNPGFSTNVTSFSIALTDAHSTLWEYHHTAPLTTNGTRSVNSNSQYRIASITKVLTDLLLLRLGLNLEDKITKYLPGLSDGNGTIEWDRVTLRDLGSHMAGVQSNYGFFDNYSTAQGFEELGFPPTNPDEWPPCGVIGLRPQRCTEEMIVEGLSNVQAVFPLHSKPTYSNAAFALLGYVVRKVTGLSYEAALKKHITVPLGMSRTTFTPISEESVVIAPNPEVLWSPDLGEYNPTGGAYSTTHDLSILIRAILSSDPHLLPQATINAWLQPITFGTDIDTAVGFPWEIVRSSRLSRVRIVDIYTKAGFLLGFSSLLGLIPSSDIGFTIFVGEGELVSTASTALAEALLARVFPAVEQATKQEVLSAGYTGRFSSGNSTIELALDQLGNGLRIDELVARGVDIMQHVNETGIIRSMRLYPSEIVHFDGDTEKEDWRLVYDYDNTVQTPLGSVDVFSTVCISWVLTVLMGTYNGQQIDRVVIRKSKGQVVSFESPALDLVLHKEQAK